jgi:type VI secretion system protein ImpC
MGCLKMGLPLTPIDLDEYREQDSLFERPAVNRVAAGLRLLVGAVCESGISVDKIDRVFLEAMTSWVDARISAQLDEILHAPEFMQLEGSWRGLRYLVDHADYSRNVRIEMLECSSRELAEDFEDSPTAFQSGLYKHVYIDEYDMPGGEPYAAIVGDWESQGGGEDLTLLQSLSQVAAAAHCPFLGSVGANFFGKNEIGELPRIEDLEHYMDRAEFIKWRAFRATEDARYVGLVLPRFLLRLPWNTTKDRSASFHYAETGRNFLWGNAAYAFVANMVRSFQENGWCVQIRGPESGGKVEGLPIHLFNAGRGLESMIPTEILIPETREYEFSRQGFIPLSYYKNRDYACFFSASSVQKATEYGSADATANARINARLPYIFLTSRIAHYLKVIQRETIGATKSSEVLEQELNTWLKGLVTQMKNPGPDLVATHPLHFAEVKVLPSIDNPGFYQVQLTLVPHFQVEGIDVSLSLISKMPSAKP